ncbi:2-hydroxyacid dehydrogenase [Sphingomonas sp. QA11]|uniref:2-hydroxyacid dehydrogenase n=1 Tax=Sphingomonas sp. QA11 TaxID=2950605 RepID=UPI002349D596|nr:2-hydroxyacid dehydrogenase [Sphingomonas sp. QA11]WCM26822.1 2-hydroxyacid dehydrogenase [Sphingomonas sp. QA11]
MNDLPDLYLPAAMAGPLMDELARRFSIHRDDPPSTTRAIVGGGSVKVDQALLDRLPALEIISVNGVGHERIDLDAMRARGVRVTTTLDILTDDVADLAIGLMLAVDRRIAFNDRVIRDGGWTVPLGRRSSGRRIGIFGFGTIGQAIARRAAVFASEVLYTARHERPDSGYRFVPDIGALAEACDTLILIAPGGDATRNIVDASVLAKLGKDGVLINVARGSLVDEPALIAALADGVIAGAGLDVFADEPHVPEALRGMDQVVLVPHQGSATVESRTEMAALVVANLDAHFAGKPLLTPIV